MALPALFWAAPPRAAAAQGALETQVYGGFVKYLAALPGEPAARETLAFLKAHPGLRFRVNWDGEYDSEASAFWDPAAQEVVISTDAFAERGVASSTETLSAEALGNYLFYYAPVLVHEITHAREDENSFKIKGLLENEMLGWANESLLRLATGYAETPAAKEGGNLWLDEYQPAHEGLNAASKGAWEASRRADELLAAGQKADYDEARAEHARLYAEYYVLLKKTEDLEAKMAVLFAGYKEPYWQQAAMVTALQRGYAPFERALKLMYPEKTSLFASPAEIKKMLADLRQRKKKMDWACPQLKNTEADYKQCLSNLDSLRRDIRLWSDPRKLAPARAHYKRALTQALRRASRVRP